LRRKLAAQVQQEIAATWRFTKKGKSAMVRPSGPLRVNNGDAMMPALIAGTGLGILPNSFCARHSPPIDWRDYAGLVAPIWRCLLDNAARRAATEVGQSPRRFSGREARLAHEARKESGIGEYAFRREKLESGRISASGNLRPMQSKQHDLGCPLYSEKRTYVGLLGYVRFVPLAAVSRCSIRHKL
jgi:hypothetical protein